jgi:hypothetical protein
VASTVLDTKQLVGPLVELVVAHTGEIQPGEPERLDRRLVVERRGEQRRRPDQVAGSHRDRVRSLHLLGQQPQLRGEELDAARLDPVDLPAGPARRFEVAVEVVQREQLHLDRRTFGAPARDHERGHDHRDGDETDHDQQSSARDRPSGHARDPFGSDCDRLPSPVWMLRVHRVAVRRATTG